MFLDIIHRPVFRKRNMAIDNVQKNNICFEEGVCINLVDKRQGVKEENGRVLWISMLFSPDTPTSEVIT
jgi:hypothetical protein